MRTLPRRAATPRRTLTLALIGTGRWGANIRRTLEALPGCRLAYMETRGWRKLLGARDLDGVLIATPGSTHARIALPFIEHGVPTFIEKPLATSLADATKLQRAQKHSSALVFVGHVHLYNPAYEVAKKHIRRSGSIRLLLAEGMNNGPFRDDMSALWDWAPHDLAMALDLLGTSPAAVQAQAVSVLRPHTRLYDAAVLRVRFAGGAEFLGHYSWLSPEKRKRFTIVGARDTIVFDDTAPRKIVHFQGLGPTVRGRTIIRREPTLAYPPYSSELPLRRELEAFLRCIRTGRAPLSDLAQGLATVRILDAAERSLKKRGALIGV